MTITYNAFELRTAWDGLWSSNFGHWVSTKGLHIVLVIAATIIATRVIRHVAGRISRRLAESDDVDATVQSEAVKHRQAVASVISSVAIAVLYVVVSVDVINTLGLPIGSLVAPAAVLGAALGFGAQRIVQDLLSGFFIITEKQYGFGDLVQLTIGASNEAVGTVDGEMFTVPNGQIVKSLNLSKDWARAVVDIPVPASSDLNRVNEVLKGVSEKAMQDEILPDLLLDQPALMGVESIGVDEITLRMVARTLPGKQFDAGRRLRQLIVAGLRREGIDSRTPATVDAA
jgi:small-conductance mechanosensitive channel